MDLSTCYCRNRHCRYYGLTGKAARLQLAGWQCGARRLVCLECGHWLSARTGTAYAGIRTSERIFRDGIRQLAEGASIRTVGRNIECDKDTVSHWLPRVGRHCLRLIHYFFRNLHLTECQLDELWTFVYKKITSPCLRNLPDAMEIPGFGPPLIPYTSWYRLGEWASAP